MHDHPVKSRPQRENRTLPTGSATNFAPLPKKFKLKNHFGDLISFLFFFFSLVPVDMDMKPVISGDMASMTSPKMSTLTATHLPTTMLSSLPPMPSSCNNNNNNNNHHHSNNSGLTMPPDALATAPTTLCGACCGPICDQYIMRVVDTFYHERCLQCFSCSMHLMHSCFARNGKLYCRIDYER